MTDDEIAEFIGWYSGTKPRPCHHPMVHTIYGSDVPGRNGTRCVICGKDPHAKKGAASGEGGGA